MLAIGEYRFGFVHERTERFECRTQDFRIDILSVQCRASWVDGVFIIWLTMFENTPRSGSEDVVNFKRVLIQSRYSVIWAFRKNEGKSSTKYFFVSITFTSFLFQDNETREHSSYNGPMLNGILKNKKKTYFSIADDIAFIDSEYSVVCLKTLVPCAPRQDNTASLPSRIGTSDSSLNTSPLMTSSFSCLLKQNALSKFKDTQSVCQKGYSLPLRLWWPIIFVIAWHTVQNINLKNKCNNVLRTQETVERGACGLCGTRTEVENCH